jgi:hypothetical protein
MADIFCGIFLGGLLIFYTALSLVLAAHALRQVFVRGPKPRRAPKAPQRVRDVALAPQAEQN